MEAGSQTCIYAALGEVEHDFGRTRIAPFDGRGGVVDARGVSTADEGRKRLV